MHHQISPWSIYDVQKKPESKRKDSKTLQKRSSPYFKNINPSTSTEFQETEQFSQAFICLEKHLQLLLSLKMIHSALREEQNSLFNLPLIRRCLILKQNILKDKGFQSLSQSKASKKLINSEQELRDLNSLKKRKQDLSILYYEPFDEEQIVSRGIMQLLRIKERQLKMLSKHRIKSNK